jgi:hypothetical protein
MRIVKGGRENAMAPKICEFPRELKKKVPFFFEPGASCLKKDIVTQSDIY